ncbi:MAG: hypothetical protein NAOJABEB_01256 [Steroidobacteraceae bacterium]|nr:hypothetical protein [Steroidobacteraceae bacterium]
MLRRTPMRPASEAAPRRRVSNLYFHVTTAYNVLRRNPRGTAMHRLARAALVAAGLLAVVGCTPSGPDAGNTKADEDTMRRGTERWIGAYSKGDVDAIMALYTEDAVVMPPGAHAATTPEALRDFLTTDIATSAGLTFELGDSATGVSGDLGWHAGAFSVKNSAGETVNTGKYLEVWRRANGKWLIVRDMWNLDAAPGSVASPAPAPTS